MEQQDFIYDETEELADIEYYEIVSVEEILKLNPTFVAFTNEEIYNYLLNFLKSKEKANLYLNLFNQIINKQQNPINLNNINMVVDAKREVPEDFDIEEFVTTIKNNNKEQIDIATKNKNQIWFPLIYDITSSKKITFKPTIRTVIDLHSIKDNNRFIIVKDDEREMPILGIYHKEPISINETYLNEKISGHLNQRKTGKYLNVDNHTTFDELIKSYKIEMPLQQINMNDEYHYTSLRNLFMKFNYDLDLIDTKTFETIKTYIYNLSKQEKEIKITYNPIRTTKPLSRINNRYRFYSALKKTYKLIEITYNSTSKLLKELENIKNEKVSVPIINDLDSLILNLNDKNYDEVLRNLKEIRKNISIDNCILSLTHFTTHDIKMIQTHFEILENKFNIFNNLYKDIFDIRFEFHNEEHDIIIGNDVREYEGQPVRVDEFKKSTVYVEEIEDEENEEEVKDDNMIYMELNKYYSNYTFNLEKGFIQALKHVLPFTIKFRDVARLPLNLDVITTHLFNLYRGKIPEKYLFIKNEIGGDFDDSTYKQMADKSISYVLLTDNEDEKLKDANMKYAYLLISMIYDIICKWSIELQKEILEETLVFSKDLCYIPCIELFTDYGSPYNMKAKDGVLYYLICVFENVYKEVYSENEYNYLPLEKNYEKKILEKIKLEYEDDLKKFDVYEKKVNKETKGLEAQRKLVKILNERDYGNEKFFDNFIDSLLYMPSVNYKKIHKYLLGCCLEQIDANFSANTYMKTNRKDLEKAKSKFSSDRVFNKKRNLRFFISKEQEEEPVEKFNPISNFISYPIYDISLEKWFSELDETKIIISKSNINDIQIKLRDVYNIHTEIYMKTFFNKKPDIAKKFKFNNYKQILTVISKILFTHLKQEALPFIKKINNTIIELDKLTSIINEDNITDITHIKTIIVIRAMCLPSFPEIKSNPKLIPQISISSEMNKKITDEISVKVFKIIQQSNMPTLEEQIDYINKIREENKNKILSILNKKTADEKDILKQMKKIGFEYQDDDEKPLAVNMETNDEYKDNEAEGEFNIREEDGYDDDDDLDKEERGFIYS
jgi:hypothetical protein